MTYTPSKARQSARNALRAHLAAFAVELPNSGWEAEPLEGADLEARAAKVADTLNTPSVPRQATHYVKFDPSAWMRAPSEKPQMRHARRG